MIKEQLNLKVCSLHKEVADSAKIIHHKNVIFQKEKLQVNQLDTGQGKNVSTGIETNQKVIECFLNAPILGDICYKQIVRNGLVGETINFFAPVNHNNADTGYKKKKKQEKKLVF